LAPLPPDSTARFKVFYTNDSAQHTVQVRGTGSPSAFGTLMDAFFTAFAPLWPATTIDEVQFAANGSDIFNAVTTTIDGNVYGSGSGADIGRAEFASFVGRTSGAHRVRIYLFGINAIASNDFRFGAGESTAIDAARAVIVGSSTFFLGIDGLVPVWKTYANAGVNAHWQKALRP